MDPETSEMIVESLRRAVNAQPAGSTKGNIQRNSDFFEEACLHMERADYRHWWDAYPDDPSHANSGIRSGIGIGNLTLPALNVTSHCGRGRGGARVSGVQCLRVS
jgi:hypothetical protein